MDEPDELLRTSQLAVLFNVSNKAVTRYAEEKGLPHVWTAGGHRRYWKRPAMAWFEQQVRESKEKNRKAAVLMNAGHLPASGPEPTTLSTTPAPGLNGSGRA